MTTALNPPVPDAARVEHPIRTTPEPAIAATIDAERAPRPTRRPEIPVPVDQAGIDVLRTEIDEIDAELVRLILRRTAVSHAIGAARRSLGGPKIVYSREMAVLQRFRDLGPAGTDLGMLLLAMGRGKLGRK